MNSNTQIKCPNCRISIDVQDILSHQLEDEIKKKKGAHTKKYKEEQLEQFFVL